MLSVFEKLITKLSKNYRLVGIDSEDLEQEGWLVVIENQDKWENMSHKDARNFMTPFIRRAMRNYCIANQRIVRIAKTKKEVKAVNNILSYATSSEEVTLATTIQMTNDLNVDEKDVKSASDFVFGSDSPITAEGKVSFSYGDKELPESSTLGMISERVLNLSALESSVDELNDREKYIINSRWFSEEKEPMRSLADKMLVTTSGIAYIESQAMLKMKSSMQQRVAA